MGQGWGCRDSLIFVGGLAKITASQLPPKTLCDDLEAKLTQSQSGSEKLMEAVVHHLLAA